MKVLGIFLFLAAIPAQTESAFAIENSSFVCVEPRSAQPFVVRGTLPISSKSALDDLVIERISAEDGHVGKTLWQEKAHEVNAAPDAHADSWVWKSSTPYKIDEGGKLSSAVFYLPPEMLKNKPFLKDVVSIVRSRLKVKLKSGELYDLRLECSRAFQQKTLDSFL